jgi:hypothetical protein
LAPNGFLHGYFDSSFWFNPDELKPGGEAGRHATILLDVAA